MKTPTIVLLFIQCWSASFCQQKNVILPAGKPYITAIFPTTDSIPSNVLRFYIEFSEPMRDGSGLSYIHVSVQNGQDMSLVFFDNNQELWNANRTKLTLLVDPGRIKSGLKGKQNLGSAFIPGKYYSIRVDSLFRNMRGQQLSNHVTKNFVALKPDTLAPALNNWTINVPHKGSYDKLVIDFHEPFDHISALSYLLLTDSKGKKVQGVFSLKKHESVWFCQPAKKWKKETYKLLVNTRLEDIAANNINGLFDHLKNTLKSQHEGLIERRYVTVK